MRGSALLWIALVVSAAAAGFAIVGVLVLRRRMESVVGLVAVLACGMAGTSVLAIANAFHRLDALIYATAFTVAGLIGGYALASSLLVRLVATARPPAFPERTDSLVDTPLILILASVESRAYDPRETASILYELSDEGVIDVSLGLTPLLFFAQKTRYRAVGDENPAYATLADVAERLAVALRPLASVEWVTCSGGASLAQRVVTAYKRGVRQVAIIPLAVAEPLQMTAAIQEVWALHPEEHGMHVVVADALADSERLMGMLMSRILAASDSSETTGVVLVGHGQPEGRAHRDPSFDENEIGFLSRLRVHLVDRGYSEKNVRVAWIDWRSPDVTSVVRHLAALGCRRLVIAPAVWPLDTLSTRLDLELSARQARVDETVSVVTLPAWGLDEAVVEELRVRARRALDRQD